MHSSLHPSKEIERRFFGTWGKLRLNGTSVLLTQAQIGSGEAVRVLGEFISILALPSYARLLRNSRDHIYDLLNLIDGTDSIKMRVRQYGEEYGKITVKKRHGIENGFKVYTEYDIPVHVRVSRALLHDMSYFTTPVKKRRYIIAGPDGKPWDIDVYEDENSWLILCEREASNTKEHFRLPKGVGLEVTDHKIWKPRISTEGLQKKPIAKWDIKTRNALFEILSGVNPKK